MTPRPGPAPSSAASSAMASSAFCRSVRDSMVAACPHRRQPIRQFLQRLPRNPRELFRRLPTHPNRNRQQKDEGGTDRSAGLRPASRAQRAKHTPLLPHIAPPAWNAGFSRHSPPPAGGPRIAPPPHRTPGLERRSPDRHRGAPRRARRDATENLWLLPRRDAPERNWRPRLGAPASGRHRARARSPR